MAEAVAEERFEWAAKLRDIYLHIAQMVEKQSVELQHPLTASVLEMRTIGSRNVFVLLHFYEGRLIDVIRDKVSVEEGDQHWIRANLEAELGLNFSSEEMQKDYPHPVWLSRQHKSKKLSAEDIHGIRALLERFFDSYVVVSSFEGENLNNDLLSTLQSRYQLSQFPYWIECVDISHLGGSWISGGLSCMKGGILDRKGYRRYKIQTGKDDYSSLKELMSRRFSHGEAVPDLFILDGGKGQLNLVKELFGEVKREGLPQFVALGKGEARKKTAIGSRSRRKNDEIISEKIYLFDRQEEIVEIPLVYDQADRLLIQLRNEAHRFSNAYRKVQMKKDLILTRK